MLKIGITGGIGSGKTTVCRIFECLGVPVFYADVVGRTLTDTDPQLISSITNTFGNKAYTAGVLNRKYIAGLVFSDPARLEELNQLVHPAVFRAFDAWVVQQAGRPYVLKEAALLYESRSYRMCDKTILVKSPEELKISRIMKRDMLSAEEIRARMQRQFTDEQKQKLADFTITNDEEHLLVPQVLSLHQQFLTLAAS